MGEMGVRRVRMGGEGARVGSDARPADHERDADVGLERPHLFHRQPHLRAKPATLGLL